MGKHRRPEVTPEPEVPLAPRRRGAHRTPRSSELHRLRAFSIAIGAGAVVAASHTLGHAPTASADTLEEVTATAPNPLPSGVSVLAVSKALDPSATGQLAKGARLGAERAARQAEARRPLTVVPTTGTLTSSYGARWGTTHQGLDIANRIGTAVVAATDGVVLESGPASGFGLWVRVQQDDGTTGVYGHIDTSLVTAGQRVQAGEQIATVGNRGQSTGPHLHYEVWSAADGTKLDPAGWLADRGVDVR